VLRKIFGPVFDNTINGWRREKNEEIRESTLYRKPGEVTKNPVASTQDEKRKNLYGARVAIASTNQQEEETMDR